jgi:hypothetical protein
MNPFLAGAIAISAIAASVAVERYADSQAYQACVEHHPPGECDLNRGRLARRLTAYEKCVEHHNPQECK